MSDGTGQTEIRTYLPPPAFAAAARVPSMDDYRRQYRRSIDDPDGFWAEVAGAFRWHRPFDRVLEWQSPDAKWFVGGRLNVAENCLDAQVAAGRGDKVAVLFEPEPVGEPVRRLTFDQLLADVCRFANALKALGVKRGDRVTIYLPHVPEAVVAMLACARIGAAHSVIFGGFSSQSIADRLSDAQSRFVITADGGYRRGSCGPAEGRTSTTRLPRWGWSRRPLC